MSEPKREQIGDAPPISGRIMWGAVLALGAPAAFLAALNVRYMLVRPACGSAAGRILQEVGTLIVLLFSIAVVWRAWRLMGRELTHLNDDRASAQPRWIGITSLFLGAFCLLSGIALWLPSLFLSPCGRP